MALSVGPAKANESQIMFRALRALRPFEWLYKVKTVFKMILGSNLPFSGQLIPLSPETQSVGADSTLKPTYNKQHYS